MSNKDSNGIELPWILYIQHAEGHDFWKIRSKIIPNPLWSHADLNSETFALMECFRDAVVHLNQSAGEAMRLHIQDTWKWK